MKNKKDSPFKSSRRTWKIDPITRIKPTKKKYKRSDNKKNIEKELENE